MEKLHPGTRWLFRFRGYVVMIFLIIIFSLPIIFVVLWIFNKYPNLNNPLRIIIIYLSFLIPLTLLISLPEIYARMTYKRWGYMFNSDGFKNSKGIIWKKYQTVPYNKIQNVDVHRGVIARIFGFSTIDIQTSGGSNSPPEGHIPGVSPQKAELIRSQIMKRVMRRHN